MADEKPLTKSDLTAAFKEFGVVVDGKLQELREQVKDDFLNTLAEFQRGEVDPRFDKLRAEMRKGIMQVNSRLESVENTLRWLKDDVEGLRADLSATPSRGEFEKLKKKVDEIYPVA